MKGLRVIASFAICSTGLACSDSPSQQPLDAGQLIVRAIDQGAPSESSGMPSTVLGTISLARYPDVLEDGEFRVRGVVVEAVAKIAVHSHEERPAIVHLVEGEVVEHRSDSEDPVIRRQGDVYFEGPDVIHWLENRSPNRAQALAFDIVSNDPE